VRAHVLAKRDRIACTIVEATRAECLLASAGANCDHGKPRTPTAERSILSWMPARRAGVRKAPIEPELMPLLERLCSGLARDAYLFPSLPPCEGLGGDVPRPPEAGRRRA
jgi:hypothetical protein